MTAIAADGFWEADINRRLRARGETLWLDPRIRVTHAGSYSASAFSRQRFVHGRVFGRSRRATFSFAGRTAHAALAPLVPVLMLGRHLRTVSARGRIDVRTLMAVPLALWFLTCWAAGEAAGLLGG
jgi:GT2 family glycosyltransferase